MNNYIVIDNLLNLQIKSFKTYEEAEDASEDYIIDNPESEIYMEIYTDIGFYGKDTGLRPEIEAKLCCF